MSSNHRVLILYASGGMGHVKAAAAIAQAFAVRHPEIVVQNSNMLEYANQAFRFVYEDGYNLISARAIRIWGWLYQHFKVQSRHELLVSLTRWGIDKKMRTALAAFRPTYILGTHPTPMRLLARHPWVPDGKIVPMGLVVTDYGCHSYWVDTRIDHYFVATVEVRAHVASLGMPAERVSATGIPVDAKFAHPRDRTFARRALKLDPHVSVVLLVGGLMPENHLRKFVAGVLQRLPAHFLIVTGRDHQLRRQLRNSILRQHPRVTIFGFIDNLDHLLAASDVVVTKAGGLTVSECLAVGVPMIIPSAIPGQEDDNINFVVHHGVGKYAPTVPEMISAAVRWLQDPVGLARTRERCRTLGRPQAADEIVDAVAKHLTVQ